MEAVATRIPFLSGAASQPPHDASLCPSFSDLSTAAGRLDGRSQRVRSKSSCQPRKLAAVFPNFLFSDQNQLNYYSSGGSRNISRAAVCREKFKAPEEMTKKKRLKLLQSLSTDLARFSDMGFGLESDADQAKAMMISDAAKLLHEQIQQLFTKEKDLEQRRKEEKSRSRSSWLECESSSSSSSESSDSECEEVVDMNLLHPKSCEQQFSTASQPVIEHKDFDVWNSFPGEGTSTDLLAPITEAELVSHCTEDVEDSTVGRVTGICNSGNLLQAHFSGISSDYGDHQSAKVPNGSSSPVALAGLSTKKIEVCMGGKCKKSGAAMLLEEFQRAVGMEGAVSGCKCMGKCKDGPNVRISSSYDNLHDANKKPAYPLCIGVGLEDVELIVSNFRGGRWEEFGPAVAS